MPAVDIPIHDIKPLIEIQEYSFYYFLALVGFGIIVLLLLAYFLYSYVKNKNKYNIRKEHLQLLTALDISDTKQAAYDVTLYGATFMQDSQNHQKSYETLVEALEEYKYKKNVKAFDTQRQNLIESYIGMLNV